MLQRWSKKPGMEISVSKSLAGGKVRITYRQIACSLTYFLLFTEAARLACGMESYGCTTPAGIKQSYPLHRRTPPTTNWDRDALRGLMYIHTDRGPMRAWLHQIRRAADPVCGCRIAQNAAHRLRADV